MFRDFIRIDNRPRIEDQWRGVARYGSKRIHTIETETVSSRLAHCGAAVQNARASRKPITCPDCLRILRQRGYSG